MSRGKKLLAVCALALGLLGAASAPALATVSPDGRYMPASPDGRYIP